MASILIGITTILSVIALRWWIKLFYRRKLRNVDGGIADMPVSDWPGLISLVLPRRIRYIWHSLVIGACTFGLGTPHLLIIWNFWNQTRLGPWLYVHYVWTLAYWLLILAFSALMIVRDQKSRSAMR